MTDFNTGSVRANGINFHYLEMGEGPLAICLHGFPDHAYSFRRLLPDLAAAGFRAVAPFMRGYAPTEAPADGRYHSALVARGRHVPAPPGRLRPDSPVLAIPGAGAPARQPNARPLGPAR